MTSFEYEHAADDLPLSPEIRAALLARAAEADAIAERWVRVFGLGFNPDTRGADYVEHESDARCLTDAQASEYDQDMERFWSVADDVYMRGLRAMQRIGLDVGNLDGE